MEVRPAHVELFALQFLLPTYVVQMCSAIGSRSTCSS